MTVNAPKTSNHFCHEHNCHGANIWRINIFHKSEILFHTLLNSNKMTLEKKLLISFWLPFFRHWYNQWMLQFVRIFEMFPVVSCMNQFVPVPGVYHFVSLFQLFPKISVSSLRVWGNTQTTVFEIPHVTFIMCNVYYVVYAPRFVFFFFVYWLIKNQQNWTLASLVPSLLCVYGLEFRSPICGTFWKIANINFSRAS